MKKIMTAMAAFTMVAGVAACSPAETENAMESAGIAGTWMADPSTAQAQNDNTVLTLADGEFACTSCLPPYSVPADGAWHAVDLPAVDEMMVDVVDDNTIKVSSRLAGKDVGMQTLTVSEDGQSMLQQFVNMRGDERTEGDLTVTRVAAGNDDAHAVSGEWQLSEYGDISDAALRSVFELDGDVVTSRVNGQTYSATLGGEAVAIEGDDSGTMVAVERVSNNAYRETYTRDGEVVSTTEMTIDGDTMKSVSRDPRDNSEFTYTSMRQ